MSKKKSILARRAWNLLRLALLWPRKDGIFKQGFMAGLRLLSNHLKSVRHTAHDSLYYREREFSFDETSIFQLKMHKPTSMRFLMPCINPPVDFDRDFDDDCKYIQDGRKSFIRGNDGDDEQDSELVSCVQDEDEEIDLKAEEFIAKFYEQMKLQRQISYLQYDEMLSRGTR